MPLHSLKKRRLIASLAAAVLLGLGAGCGSSHDPAYGKWTPSYWATFVDQCTTTTRHAGYCGCLASYLDQRYASDEVHTGDPRFQPAEAVCQGFIH